MEQNTIDIAKQVINEWHNANNQYVNAFIKNSSIVIDDFNKVLDQHKKLNEETSCDFNLFQFFNPGETMHSQIIAFFLNPNETHGQGNLFLVPFLKMLEVPNPNEGQWIVTAETGRIDVLIKRKHPNSVIIIENKSNWAVDQPNQIYRYWYQEIYHPNKLHKHSFLEQETYKKDEIQNHFQIVYLPPNKRKQVDSQSLFKPKEWEKYSDLPEELPIKIRQESFNEFIVNWLNQCVFEIKSKDNLNTRIYEFTNQYLKFWSNN